MSNLMITLAYLAEKEPYIQLLSQLLNEGKQHLLQIATQLKADGLLNDAMTIVNHILENHPHDIDALVLSAQIFIDKQEVSAALEQIIFAKDHQLDFPVFITNQIILATVETQQKFLAEGKIQQATRIVELVSKIHTSADFSHNLFSLNSLQYSIDSENVTRFREEQDAKSELEYRIALFKNPFDATRNSAIRLNNIYESLNCIFMGNITRENIDIAREMLKTAREYPVTNPIEKDSPDQHIACFERYYRILFEIIDMDKIFAPPPALKPSPIIHFRTSNGAPVSLQAIQEYISKNQTEVVFFSQASEMYSKKFGHTYLKSLKKSSDCNFIAILCVISEPHLFDDIIEHINFQDERVFFYNDTTISPSDIFEAYYPNKIETTPWPTYYSSVGLFRMDYLLENFNLPVFLSGIDTILRNGVREIVERFQGYDFILNRINHFSSIASQYINSLVLAYPTYPSLIFGNFMKHYLGDVSLRRVQPFSHDQALLVFAVSHVQHNFPNAKIGFFEPHDINNAMFTNNNISHHIDYFNKFHFINIFHAGVMDDYLDPESYIHQNEITASEQEPEQD
ncbi:MAG: hypothetical protein HQL55_00515 [Magnetococcales bacterium]|nr:hypothetical protein [Magnetococcales bacterium]